MYITAHCFLKNAKIDKVPITFSYDGFDVSINTSKIDGEEGLVLEIKKVINPEDLKTKPEDRDPMGHFIEKQLRPYKSKLHEIASIIEGILSVNYMVTDMPTFETHKVITNVFSENYEEEDMLKSGEITRGFGDIASLQKPDFVWKEGLLDNIDKAKENIPALSFIAQAIRSQARKDQEIAFFLYFRIIEGYFGDGTPSLEKALLANAEDFKNYLAYDQGIITSMQKILSILGLPSKSNVDFNGLISDIVLMRHKMTHFDSENSDRHFSPELKFEMDLLNKYLRVACTKIIRDKID